VVTRPKIGGHPYEFGDTKYRQIVCQRRDGQFREVSAADRRRSAAIQRVNVLDGNGTQKTKLVHHVRSTAAGGPIPCTWCPPSLERHDDGPTRTHVRHGNAVRVWLRRPWFSSGDGEQLGVVLEPASKLPRGWVQAKDSIKARVTAIDVPIRANVRRRASPTGGTTIGASGPVTPGHGARSVGGRRRAGGDRRRPPAVGKAAISAVIAGLPTKGFHAMLHPYVTKWGNGPVWAS
jgi:hypothetical protein